MAVDSNEMWPTSNKSLKEVIIDSIQFKYCIYFSNMHYACIDEFVIDSDKVKALLLYFNRFNRAKATRFFVQTFIRRRIVQKQFIK